MSEVRDQHRRSRHIWRALLLAAVAVGAGGAYMLSAPLETNSVASSTASQFPKPIPSVSLESADGRPMTLADFRGKAVLLNVWATWCPPCRKEMPSLDRLQAKLGGDDFEVVPLSIDRNGVDVVKPFFDEIGIQKLAIYLDRASGVMSSLKVVGLPTTLLIGRDGRELMRWVGPKEWDAPEVIEEIQDHLSKSGKSS